MKTKLLAVLAAVSLAAPCVQTLAGQTADASAELKDLVTKVNTKLKEGKRTEADLTPELKQFDKILAEHKGEKTDAVARVLFMKAMLYQQVFDEPDKAATLVQQLKTDFPDTTVGKSADHVLAMIKEQQAAKAIQAKLVKGARFPDFNEPDVEGKPLSIAQYKGKVVLVDFWATWCPPCRAELPNVLETYKKHHAAGFEIVGISLDQQKAKLTSFTKQEGMAWRQYCDEKGWQNKLAEKYGVRSIPATFLLDPEGKIIGKDLRGPALEEAVSAALAKN
jgi:peroxiredoxin